MSQYLGISECGGDFSAPVGMFTSPNYPNRYPHNRVCEWRITVEEGRRVILTINDMRTEEHWRCSSDYVAVSIVCEDRIQNVIQLKGHLCLHLVLRHITVSSRGNR